MKLQMLLSYVRRAIDEYNMIQEGDRIAVGISGGKDSLALLVALSSLSRFYPKKFELEAVTVSLGLPGSDYSPVEVLCKNLGLRYTVVETDIGSIIFDERKEKNPCSLCSKMRKGALNEAAKKLSCNKVALGHNKDDLIETFFLSLFYEGRIHTFTPLTYLDRTDLYSIRPLIYATEDDIRKFINMENIQIVKSPCPVDGKTKRQEIKEFVSEQSKIYNDFEEKIFAAIKGMLEN